MSKFKEYMEAGEKVPQAKSFDDISLKDIFKDDENDEWKVDVIGEDGIEIKKVGTNKTIKIELSYVPYWLQDVKRIQQGAYPGATPIKVKGYNDE